ncbi:histidine phosphatase family protein [Deinococcus aquiradiocola]|uniref:Phosphoglycerate mutase n=1 Tax=Deinococcus aquiradiocola TaxID=393059 RepID=A0A917PQP7_9DEIO|nr:histidine phosphatase family protein [Deinococcus aquiradiocola]GGJ87482.1 phosphoglycerate mutase [Deinococcus aquiradiocola]
MSQLLLVRHGQATPFEADTDRLSPLGERQANAVGAFLQASGVQPTRVVHGPLVRQTRSAQLAHAAAGGHWPAPEGLPGLAEYDGDGLLRHLAPILAERDPDFRNLYRDAEALRENELPDRNRAFQKMLERLTDTYLTGETTHPQVESWADFRSRVRAAVRDLLASPTGSTVVAFTSGGVIGSVVAGVLDAPDASALKLNWRVRNASITRLTFGTGRVSLDSFNETAHLTPDLLSWR